MNPQLEQIKNQLLQNANIDPALIIRIQSIGKDKKRPLGKTNVSAWIVEITRGCNLQCGFCATRLFPKNEYKFMRETTWIRLMQLISILTPYNRIELANAGEPTLHPDICNFLKIGREISPHTHFQVITNGVKLIKGEITYQDLFMAGANIIYVDMYTPEKEHILLAEQSGYAWYLRKNKKETDPAAWSYYPDPNLKCIVFQDQPGHWSKRKQSAGYFSTFMNNLDWEAAKKYDIFPVEKAPNRRCNQPFRMCNVGYDGSYSFCCFDFVRNIYGKIGSVHSGVPGFFKFWLGNYMQYTRRLLHFKDRPSHPLCQKCAFTSSRGDIPCWDDNSMNTYWTGTEWKPIEIIGKENES